MEISTARESVNLVVWYRNAEFPAAAPTQVRIMSTGVSFVRVSVQLDAALPARPDQCFDAFASDLHFERTGFDDIDIGFDIEEPVTERSPAPTE